MIYIYITFLLYGIFNLFFCNAMNHAMITNQNTFTIPHNVYATTFLNNKEILVNTASHCSIIDLTTKKEKIFINCENATNHLIDHTKKILTLVTKKELIFYNIPTRERIRSYPTENSNYFITSDSHNNVLTIDPTFKNITIYQNQQCYRTLTLSCINNTITDLALNPDNNNLFFFEWDKKAHPIISLTNKYRLYQIKKYLILYHPHHALYNANGSVLAIKTNTQNEYILFNPHNNYKKINSENNEMCINNELAFHPTKSILATLDKMQNVCINFYYYITGELLANSRVDLRNNAISAFTYSSKQLLFSPNGDSLLLILKLQKNNFTTTQFTIIPTPISAYCDPATVQQCTCILQALNQYNTHHFNKSMPKDIIQFIVYLIVKLPDIHLIQAKLQKLLQKNPQQLNT